MARYRGPTCRLSRREGQDLQLKSGMRSLKDKCGEKKAETPPGMHGDRRLRPSDYRVQLREKQKVRRMYGVLERQFRNYYRKAARATGATGSNLLRMLEQRLDNVVYRLGFAATRAEARQLVSHRAIEVNGRRVNIPSYQLVPGDVVTVAERARAQGRLETALMLASQRVFAPWIDIDAPNRSGVYRRHPDRDEMPGWINESLIVELYSK